MSETSSASDPATTGIAGDVKVAPADMPGSLDAIDLYEAAMRYYVGAQAPGAVQPVYRSSSSGVAVG